MADAPKPAAAAADPEATPATTPATTTQAQPTVTKTATAQVGPSERCSLAFSDVTYTVKLKDGSTKRVLDRCNGVVAPGEVLAIMGPSGSGKTSLLDALAKRLRSSGATLSGNVLFNGRRVRGTRRRELLSYVAQEDTLMGVFTVRETLWYAARLFFGYQGLGGRKPSAAIAAQIEGLIEALGLSSCADTIVGNLFFKGLSGGQKKRLSIAIELISSPPIILLDEPTSGLDSASAFAIMQELRHLAKLGHTVVATIHQPSSEIWSLFDSFCLMGNGVMCYFGEARNATSYFGSLGYTIPANYNPADFCIGLVTFDFDPGIPRPASARELGDKFEASPLKRTVLERIALGAQVSPASQYPVTVDANTAIVLEGASAAAATAAATTTTTAASSAAPSTATSRDLDADEPESASCYRRFFTAGGGAGFTANFITLTQRNIINVVRNPGIILVRLIMYTALCVFIGLTFLNLGYSTNLASVTSRAALLFFVQAFLVFMSVAAIPFIMEEKSVFMREKTNGAYTALAYVCAHAVSLLPGTFVMAVISSIIVVYMIHLNNVGNFIAILWLSLVYAEAMVLMVGSFSPHYIIGIALAAGLFGLFMVVMGFFIPFTEIGWWIRWIGYCTPHRYSWKAFMINEFGSIGNMTATGFPTGQAVLDFYFGTVPGAAGGNLVYSVGGLCGILIAFAAAFLVVMWLVLQFKH